MTILKECKMPDLSDLNKDKLVSSYLLLSVFSGSDSNLDKKFISYRKIFVRLVDKTIYEYSLVREAIINQINAKSGEIYMFSAVDHLENCINSVRRLFYLFDRIKSNKENPFTINKVLRRFINSYLSKIKDIRDFVEHIDGDIQNGTIRDNQPIALKINENASEVSIGKYNLSLLDLAMLIIKFHEIGSELAKYNARSVDQGGFKTIIKK